MALSRANFLASFPEFQNTPESLLDAKLAEAALQMHLPTWGELAAQGQGLLTAALLANAQRGLNSRLQSQANTSTYREDYERLRQRIARGPRLIRG